MQSKLFKVADIIDRVLSTYLVLLFMVVVMICNYAVTASLLKPSDSVINALKVCSNTLDIYIYPYIFVSTAFACAKILFADLKLEKKIAIVIVFIVYAVFASSLYAGVFGVLNKYLVKEGLDLTLFNIQFTYFVLVAIYNILRLLFGVHELLPVEKFNAKLVDFLADKYGESVIYFDNDKCNMLMSKYGGYKK